MVRDPPDGDYIPAKRSSQFFGARDPAFATLRLTINRPTRFSWIEYQSLRIRFPDRFVSRRLTVAFQLIEYMPDSPTSPASPPRPARLPFYYGWVVVGVAFVTMGIGVNARTAFSLLFPPILDEFGWDRGATAGAFSIGFVVSALLNPFIGIMIDRFGPRYTQPLGAILMAAGMVLATYASEPWHIYLTLGVLVIGGSIFVAYIGHSIFLPNWFERKRGLAIGIAFSGVGVGSIVLFPLLQGVIDAVGWREACWTMAILMIAVLVPLNILLQRRHPRDLGLLPDGAVPKESRTETEAPVDNIVDRAWAARDWTLASAARTARFWWISLGFFCGLFAWYAVQVHQTKYLIEIGFDAETAAVALGLVGLTGIVGQIGLGHLSDRIGRELVWTICLLGYVLCYLLLLAMKGEPSMVLLYLMVSAQGLLGYGLASLYGSIPADIFLGRRFGAILGTMSFASSLGAGAGPWLTGVIYDRTGGYELGFWVAIVLSIISIGAIWLAAPRKVRAVAGRIDRINRHVGSR